MARKLVYPPSEPCKRCEDGEAPASVSSFHFEELFKKPAAIQHRKLFNARRHVATAYVFEKQMICEAPPSHLITTWSRIAIDEWSREQAQ